MQPYLISVMNLFYKSFLTGFFRAFSVDGGRFITPWITVADGHGTYLQFIEFIFTYSGDEIIEMKWKTDCMTPFLFSFVSIVFLYFI